MQRHLYSPMLCEANVERRLESGWQLLDDALIMRSKLVILPAVPCKDQWKSQSTELQHLKDKDVLLTLLSNAPKIKPARACAQDFKRHAAEMTA